MNIYKRYRFPPDIISYAVWLYYRFNLSHRDIVAPWLAVPGGAGQGLPVPSLEDVPGSCR